MEFRKGLSWVLYSSPYYVNDMTNIGAECDLVKYVDDAQSILSGSPNDIKGIKDTAKYTMDRAKHYFDSNGLKVNPQKTQAIFIGSRQNIAKIPSDTKINFDGNLIEPTNHVKNLGVVSDNYMNFDKHIDEIRRKTVGILVYLKFSIV